jgi:hypothetical protein
VFWEEGGKVGYYRAMTNILRMREAMDVRLTCVLFEYKLMEMPTFNNP